MIRWLLSHRRLSRLSWVQTIRRVATQIGKQETLAMPSLIIAAIALLLTMLPMMSTPLVHLLAMIGLILGIFAWMRRENRFVTSAAIGLAVLALVWRYLFMLLLFLFAAIALDVWKGKRRRNKRKQVKSNGEAQ